MADLETLLRRLIEHGVEFVLVGGFAKEHLNRPRDREAVIELRAIRERSGGTV